MKWLLTRTLVLAFPCMAMAQIAVLQIKVLEGEGAVHPAGAHIARPLIAQVTDENGRPVAGAAVSFQLPAEGPSGIFSNGLRTDLVITDASGRAAIHAMQLNRTGGQFRIRITAVKAEARAGVVSVQYIAEDKAAAAASGAGRDPTKPRATQPTTESGEITPTTTKMSSGHHKKWYVLAAIAVAGGVAFMGVSRASGSPGSTAPSGVVSIGAPSITIGHP